MIVMAPRRIVQFGIYYHHVNQSVLQLAPKKKELGHPHSQPRVHSPSRWALDWKDIESSPLGSQFLPSSTTKQVARTTTEAQ